ncbi:ATP-dependent RNA helicase [Hirsutella rhossiliensis]|uniref:ATP-dependent RNA helicase n=1 Tax=Hirsutella rhossiliensis TaxID=111463 RepID=A0A9P8SIC4_9HYPO|nr:ATP-dependent RNA helicase [Hirsutella rhossiliensis]KAH0963034.1 ATP-dependent RNA helicase [Hirsutella rhossiliensis]
MPRPKRTRRAPPGDAKAPEPPSDTEHLSDDAGRPRGRKRTRTTRHPTSRLSLGEQDAIRAANRTRDAALDRLANEDATTASGNATGDDTRSFIETGRRAMATPAMRRDTTGLDLADDDVFGDLDDSFADGEMPRGRRSGDSSSLAMSHFKPRSRQSSIVGRNDPPIRPSSRGPTTPALASSFNIGLFRRRVREPSILGTSRKPRLEAETTTTNDSDVGSEASFEPEAESTPLNGRRPTRRSPQVERETSPAQSSSRKRKSVEASDDSDRPDKTSRLEPDAGRAEIDSDSELSILASPSPPPPGLLPRPVTPVIQDEINAPPASSDSEGDVDVWPDIHVLARRRRRPSVNSPLRAENLSEVSSPPSLTHSPNYVAEKATRQRGRSTTRRQQSPKITTADLTNLLPKRRHKRIRNSLGLESDEELDTTDLAQDEDELSYLDARAARRRKGSRPPSRAASARPASRARANSSVLKPKQTPASLRQSARSNKTYRRRSSDKENESDGDEEGESALMPLPDNTFDEAGTGDSESPSNASADELKQAARKFMEVDKWELEFEEVVEPPSPQDAR